MFVIKAIEGQQHKWWDLVKRTRWRTTTCTCRGSRSRRRTRTRTDDRRGSESRNCNWANIYTGRVEGSGSGRRAAPTPTCRCRPIDGGSASSKPPPEQLSTSGEPAAVWPERGRRCPWAEPRFVSGSSSAVPELHFSTAWPLRCWTSPRRSRSSSATTPRVSRP